MALSHVMRGRLHGLLQSSMEGELTGSSWHLGDKLKTDLTFSAKHENITEVKSLSFPKEMKMKASCYFVLEE